MSDLIEHGKVNQLIKDALRRKSTRIDRNVNTKDTRGQSNLVVKDEEESFLESEGMFSFLEEKPFMKIEEQDTSFTDISFLLDDTGAVPMKKEPFKTQQKKKRRKDLDSRSIYIGNVDYGTKPVELQQIFSNAGLVNRVTIMLNKYTGYPKGFAYLEFDDMKGVLKAIHQLDGYLFRGRCLKVKVKRTNIPGRSRDLNFCTKGRPDLVHKFLTSKKRHIASKGRNRYI